MFIKKCVNIYIIYMSQMSKDITPSCPRSGTVPDCPVQGHVPSKYQHCIPAYKKHVKRVFKKGKQGENVNYIKSSEGERSMAMRCNAGIEGRVIEAIIDSEAEVTAMSRGLMDKLGYEIDEPSNIIIKSANGQRNRSLGRIN